MEEQPSDPSPSVPDVRVSNDERNAVVDLLRDQTSAGRLTLGEFEERLEEVYSSRTATQLRHALRELPVEPPPMGGGLAPVEQSTISVEEPELRRRYRVRLRNDVAGFVVPNFICNAIWALSGTGYWWPGWVLMGTGVGIVGTLIRGFDPEKERAALMAERRKEGIAAIEARHPGVRYHSDLDNE